MKRKRDNSDNLVHRLLRRETASAPPAATISQSRRFFETIVPNTAIKGIQPPPGFCLSRFTPCGRFLISFDALKNEVVLHSYKGINLDTTETPETAAATTSAAAEGTTRQHQQQPRRPQPNVALKFEDAFALHARCPVVTGPDEQLFAFSLAVHTDYLVLASSTPDARPVDGEGGAWLGVSENVTFHLLDMLSGQILDRLTLRADSIHLTHLGAASLYDDTMAIVAPGQKKIYVVKIDKEPGRMWLIRTLGPRCREDDAYGAMDGIVVPEQNDNNSTVQIEEGGEEEGGERIDQQGGGGDGGGDGGTAAAAAAAELVIIERRPSDDSDEVLLLDDVPTPLLIEGLKQRLLARLYLDAVERTRILAAEQQQRKKETAELHNQHHHQQPQHPQQRTVLPIEQFYYFFDVYLELEMHAVLLLDPSRLLITWMPPLNHRGTSHLPSHIRGLHMLYDMTSTCVERVFEGGSADFADWCLVTPTAVTGGAPANDWERYLTLGLWGHHVRRKAAQDPFLRTTLNHPGCQQQQGSPYLDPEIFQFDERAVTRDLVPRPPLHRAAKFVARAWPERLRFKFEPEDVMGSHAAGGNNAAAAAGRGGGGGENENATEVVFIFHPVAPFVVAVVESTETGLAEELAFFTHNS